MHAGAIAGWARGGWAAGAGRACSRGRPGGGAHGGRGRARWLRFPFWAEARGGKVEGLRGAASGQAASATLSRFLVPAAPPWTTSVSEQRRGEEAASGARPRPSGRERAERRGPRDPTRGGQRPGSGPCRTGLRGTGLPGWA